MVILLVVLLLSTVDPSVPASLSNSGLKVRRDSLDILHDALNSGTRLVAVTVQGTLEEHSPASKDSALEPSHAVSEVIQSHLLATGGFHHARNGNFALGLTHGDLDHLLAISVTATAASISAFSLLDTVIVLVLAKEARSRGAWGRALHLTREVAAWEHTGSLAETIGNLVGVDTLKGDSHTEAGATHIVLDEDELALLGFRDIGEEIIGLITSGSTVALGRHGTSSMGSHVRHLSTSVRLVIISGEHVSRSHIVTRNSRSLSSWRLVVMVLVRIAIA